MKPEVRPLGFWSTVRLLLRVARTRSRGRLDRQEELLNKRSTSSYRGFGLVMATLFMVAINVCAAFVVRNTVDSAERYELEREGRVLVSAEFALSVQALEEVPRRSDDPSLKEDLESLPYSREAKRIADEYGGSQPDIEGRIRNTVGQQGSRGLVSSEGGIAGSGASGTLPALLGSVVLFCWFVMLVCQGEGLDMDTQRRRNPIWEFLFSHPVPTGAIFLAEMLSPIAANPVYWGAPLFVGFLYGFAHGIELGVLAAFLVGIPVTVAAGCLGKALEVAVMLRMPARSRGAVIGLMGWFGFSTLMLFLVGIVFVGRVVTSIALTATYLTVIPWPWLQLFLGGTAAGSYSFVFGLTVCWLTSGVAIAGAVRFSVWSTQKGLAGNFSSDVKPSAVQRSGKRFGKEPLYRKEFLWFIRDRSAIVQTILIPLTVAGYQVFNLRSLAAQAQGAWNYLCGAAILFGTYFLWVLGPKSLTSEGTALWIALTWPRGLESLLKAKAWLWSLISTGMVAMVLCYAAYSYPAKIPAILMVGVGWFFFSRTMAEKTVTLVTVTSDSGERGEVHWGRKWAAQLGMFTFAIGILTQQWSLAVVGIVYSYLTAAAMWENFRARLPYLYDPWSEQVPQPPTLMHAMVAISIFLEAGAVITGIAVGVGGKEYGAIGRAIGYALSAIGVCIGTSLFLSERNVLLHDVTVWGGTQEERARPWWRGDPVEKRKYLLGLLGAVACAIMLGAVAYGYEAILKLIPSVAELINKSRQEMASVPFLKASYFVMAVGFAPFAEEYLFRGLVYRALDREWGGWRAVVGSAAFFVIYHHPLAWLPVGLLGVANAIIFKKTGRLAPAVVLHMVYNAVVLSS